MIGVLSALPSRVAMALIRLYQLTLGLMLPPSCRFSPSCSHYALQALARHGLLAGLWLTFTRLGRCHPWGGCGHDPVPSRFRWWPAHAAHHPPSSCSHAATASPGEPRLSRESS